MSATLTTTTSLIWQSRAGDTPARLAALYRDAAQRIRAASGNGWPLLLAAAAAGAC